MKKTTTLLHLLLSAAALAVPLVPMSTGAAAGDLYVADQTPGTIFKFAPDGTQSMFASALGAPAGVAFDSRGNLFVAESGNNSISEFTPGGIQSTFASGLSGPADVAFDSSGNLFVADNLSGTIFKFTPDGTKGTFASGLNNPQGLALTARAISLRRTAAAARSSNLLPTESRAPSPPVLLCRAFSPSSR